MDEKRLRDWIEKKCSELAPTASWTLPNRDSVMSNQFSQIQSALGDQATVFGMMSGGNDKPLQLKQELLLALTQEWKTWLKARGTRAQQYLAAQMFDTAGKNTTNDLTRDTELEQAVRSLGDSWQRRFPRSHLLTPPSPNLEKIFRTLKEVGAPLPRELMGLYASCGSIWFLSSNIDIKNGETYEELKDPFDKPALKAFIAQGGFQLLLPLETDVLNAWLNRSDEAAPLIIGRGVLGDVGAQVELHPLSGQISIVETKGSRPLAQFDSIRAWLHSLSEGVLAGPIPQGVFVPPKKWADKRTPAEALFEPQPNIGRKKVEVRDLGSLEPGEYLVWHPLLDIKTAPRFSLSHSKPIRYLYGRGDSFAVAIGEQVLSSPGSWFALGDASTDTTTYVLFRSVDEADVLSWAQQAAENFENMGKVAKAGMDVFTLPGGARVFAFRGDSHARLHGCDDDSGQLTHVVIDLGELDMATAHYRT